jgi:hypothetical protein
MARAHLHAPEDERSRRPARPPRRPPVARRLAELQRSAGNRAVTQIIARQVGGAGATAPAEPKPRLVRRKEIDREIEETISHAPAGYERWNNTFRWRAKWRLKLDMRDDTAELNVKVRLFSTASNELKRKWSRAIRNKWSGKFGFGVLDEDGELEELYPINVEVEWVSSEGDAHYTIDPHAAGDTEDGRYGVSGTVSMLGWGETDTVDVAHEFGHMLGCPEEYFTTNGFDWTFGGRRQGWRDRGGGVMNNPAGAALERNFSLIRKEAAKLRGVKLAKTKIVPWP